MVMLQSRTGINERETALRSRQQAHLCIDPAVIEMVGRDGIEPSTNGLKVADENSKAFKTQRSLVKRGKAERSLESAI